MKPLNVLIMIRFSFGLRDKIDKVPNHSWLSTYFMYDIDIVIIQFTKVFTLSNLYCFIIKMYRVKVRFFGRLLRING